MKLLIFIYLLVLPVLCAAQDWPIKDLDTGRGETYLSEDEKEIIILVNKVRTNPPLFAKTYMENIKDRGPYYRECYDQLLVWKPQAILKPSKALHLAAKDHATDMGETGATGHKSSKGEDSATRVKRYGDFKGIYNGPWETCSYGYSKPLDIVLQLLVDDGVESRGHRLALMESAVHFMGTSIKPHKTYRFNCVIDFADSIEDKK